MAKKHFGNVLLFAVALLLPLASDVHGQRLHKRGVADSFNEGLKYAGQMLGVNNAADVANLVAKAFATVTSNNDNNNNNPTAGPGSASQRKRPTDFLTTLLQQFQQQPSENVAPPEGPPVRGASGQWQTSKESPNSAEQQETQQSAPQSAGAAAPTAPAGGFEAAGLNSASTQFVTSLLRMVGFDASKLGALAINAMIMIAQAIGSALMSTTNAGNGATPYRRGPTTDAAEGDAAHAQPPPYAASGDHQPRQASSSSSPLADDTPIDWLLNQAQSSGGGGRMQRLLQHATDAELAEQLVHMIERLETRDGQEGACLKMLMCKSAPFIWGMQRSLQQRFNDTATDGNDDNNNKKEQPAAKTTKETPTTTQATPPSALNTQAFFAHLPSREEYRQHGEGCERRYADHCDTRKLA